MKLLTALATLALVAAPVQAQSLQSSLKNYCEGARTLNELGYSVAPGTNASVQVARIANESMSNYSRVYYIAKGTYCTEIY